MQTSNEALRTPYLTKFCFSCNSLPTKKKMAFFGQFELFLGGLENRELPNIFKMRQNQAKCQKSQMKCPIYHAAQATKYSCPPPTSPHPTPNNIPQQFRNCNREQELWFTPPHTPPPPPPPPLAGPGWAAGPLMASAAPIHQLAGKELGSTQNLVQQIPNKGGSTNYHPP